MSITASEAVETNRYTPTSDEVETNRCPSVKTNAVYMFGKALLYALAEEESYVIRQRSMVDIATEWEIALNAPRTEPPAPSSNKFEEVTFHTTTVPVEMESMFIDRYNPPFPILSMERDEEEQPPNTLLMRVYESRPELFGFYLLCEECRKNAPKRVLPWYEPPPVFFAVDAKGRVVLTRDERELKTPGDKLYLRVGPNHFIIESLPHTDMPKVHSLKAKHLLGKIDEFQKHGPVFVSIDPEPVNTIVVPEAETFRVSPKAPSLRRTLGLATLPRFDEDTNSFVYTESQREVLAQTQPL